MLGKAFPDEVAVEGGGLVLIAYILPAAPASLAGKGQQEQPWLQGWVHHSTTQTAHEWFVLREPLSCVLAT